MALDLGVHFGDEKAVKRLFFALVLLSSLPLAGDDWPQYLGADRDAVWREAGVELDFSKRAPRLLWSSPLGSGYAGPAVSEGRVFLMDRQARPYVPQKLEPGTNINFVRARIPGRERVLCLKESDGELLWEHSYEAKRVARWRLLSSVLHSGLQRDGEPTPRE